jgi:hypothetical protein
VIFFTIKIYLLFTVGKGDKVLKSSEFDVSGLLGIQGLNLSTRDQCYKTFHFRNLQMFVICQREFVSGKSFQPYLVYVGKISSSVRLILLTRSIRR